MHKTAYQHLWLKEKCRLNPVTIDFQYFFILFIFMEMNKSVW